MSRDDILLLQDVKKHFRLPRQVGQKTRVVRAVDGISLSIGRHRTLGLVGESGCGKTTTKKLVLRLEKPDEGRIEFDGSDIQSLDRSGLKEYRRSVQAVFQDPYGSLNPRLRVRDAIVEPLRATGRVSRKEAVEVAAERLVQVGLPADVGDRFPHEFSGGQRQRIALARALVNDAELVLLDEPVASLDVSVQSQIINLLKDLQDRLGVSYLLITHNMAVSRHLSHLVAVMYLGRIVETGDSDLVYQHPLHPYTKALFDAVPQPDPDAAWRWSAPTADGGSAMDVPTGCRFHPRCPLAMPVCSDVEPCLRTTEDEQQVACHLYDPEFATNARHPRTLPLLQ